MDLLQLLRDRVIDPKTRQRKRYQTSDILFLSVLAISMGATNIKEVALWIKQNIKTKLVKDLLGVRFTLIPSNATVHRRLSSISTKEISDVFQDWYNSSFSSTISTKSIDGSMEDKNCIDILLDLMEENKLIQTNRFIIGSKVVVLQDMEDKSSHQLISTFSPDFHKTA